MLGTSVTNAVAVDERREFDRFTCEIPTTCQPPAAWRKDPWPATIRDISNSGICLVLNRRFEKGAGLAVELPTDQGKTSTSLARVVHVRPLPEGGWLLGCHFISELSDDEIDAVRAFAAAAARMDTESDAPAPVLPTLVVHGVLFQMRTGPHDLLRWFVKHLDLTARWPLTRGAVVALRLGGPAAAEPPVEIGVKRCRLIGTYWIIDGKLLAPPSPAVLRALSGPAAP
ncbi:MAG: PilZ domain-containing protein [Gemmataceae bacterium]